MALRIYPIRPLRPRGYYGAQNQSPYAGAFKQGGSMGSELIKGIGAAMKARQQQQQQDQLNALANKLENTAAPPRAGAVGPVVNPAIGQVTGNITPTVGTAPFGAGEAGLKLQQEFQKNQMENYVRQANIAASLGKGGAGGGGGGAGNASRWQQYLGGGKNAQVDQFGNPVKAGKPAAYVAGSSTPNDDAYYNFDHQRTDLDTQYGMKGIYNKLLANAGNITIDPKTGKYGVKIDPVTKEPVTSDIEVNPDSGDVSLKSAKGATEATIPYADLQSNMKRYDGTLVAQGKQPRFTDQYLKTQNPQTGLPGGDMANPYTPGNTPEERQAIPPGKWYINPLDGKPYQKQAPGASAASAKPTAQADTGDQGQQVASGQPQTQMPSLLQPLSAGQPQTQGLAGGDQGQGQDYTGGGAQLSPVIQGPQPPVDPMAVAASNTPGSFFPGATPSDGGLPSGVNLGEEIARTQLASRLQGVA